jgi:hypothetical protein
VRNLLARQVPWLRLAVTGRHVSSFYPNALPLPRFSAELSENLPLYEFKKRKWLFDKVNEDKVCVVATAKRRTETNPERVSTGDLGGGLLGPSLSSKFIHALIPPSNAFSR